MFTGRSQLHDFDMRTPAALAAGSACSPRKAPAGTPTGTQRAGEPVPDPTPRGYYLAEVIAQIRISTHVLSGPREYGRREARASLAGALAASSRFTTQRGAPALEEVADGREPFRPPDQVGIRGREPETGARPAVGAVARRDGRAPRWRRASRGKAAQAQGQDPAAQTTRLRITICINQPGRRRRGAAAQEALPPRQGQGPRPSRPAQALRGASSPRQQQRQGQRQVTVVPTRAAGPDLRRYLRPCPEQLPANGRLWLLRVPAGLPHLPALQRGHDDLRTRPGPG